MVSVFDVLGRDHVEVQRMLAELETGPTGATGASATHLALRKKMVEELIIEESRHEAAEEMYFWPVVRERLPNGDELADHAIGQEQEAKKVLGLLDRLDASQPEFEDVLAMFIKAGRDHIAYEETIAWPPLAAALSTQDAADLGSKIEQAKKTAPTRPHPGTPPKPGVLKGAGPVVAAMDRLRDAASGRGKD
jgi:Hemerythrin HHE cation binding domain